MREAALRLVAKQLAHEPADGRSVLELRGNHPERDARHSRRLADGVLLCGRGPDGVVGLLAIFLWPGTLPCGRGPFGVCSPELHVPEGRAAEEAPSAYVCAASRRVPPI